MRASAAAVATVLTAAVLTGCSSGSSSTSSSGDTSATLTASEYGSAWPLTVDSAVVHCYRAGQAQEVTATINGTEYAVNGAARSVGKWDDFTASGYWKADTSGLGLKVDISPILDKGLGLCS